MLLWGHLPLPAFGDIQEAPVCHPGEPARLLRARARVGSGGTWHQSSRRGEMGHQHGEEVRGEDELSSKVTPHTREPGLPTA